MDPVQTHTHTHTHISLSLEKSPSPESRRSYESITTDGWMNYSSLLNRSCMHTHTHMHTHISSSMEKIPNHAPTDRMTQTQQTYGWILAALRLDYVRTQTHIHAHIFRHQWGKNLRPISTDLINQPQQSCG